MAPRKASPKVAAMTEISKAQVTLPPPGGTTRFALLGGRTEVDILNYNKRQQYAIYYEMYRQHPVVRAAIDKKSAYAVAGGIVFHPLDTEQELSDTKSRALQLFFRRSNVQQLLRITHQDLDIYGESFWLIIRSESKTSTPIKAMRLNPRYVQPVIVAGFVVAWDYGPINGIDAVRYDDNIILHFKINDPEDETQGLSPLHSLQRAVAQDIFAMEYNEGFFKNSAQTGIIFVVKTSTSGEAERNRAWLEQNYVGVENSHKPLLLEGDVTVEHSVSSSHEMEFLEGRRFLRQEIIMVLEMDPDMLGIHDNSNRSVAKVADERFHSETIWPRQVLVAEEINNKLIQTIFGWSDIMIEYFEGDPRRKVDLLDEWDKNQRMGRMSVNDIRKKQGLPPVKGGDIYTIMTPTGLIPVDKLSELQVPVPKGSASSATPSSAPVGVATASSSAPKPNLSAKDKEAVSQHEPK